jgi:hypothetical protein
MMLTATEPNVAFAKLASDEQIERTAQALEANGIHTLVADNGDEAKKMVFDLLPEGAEVFTATSQTLETLGIKDEIEKSGRYEALRPKMFAMDRETQGREIRKLGGAPDYAAGSVHAVTEDGRVLIASNTGSQLGRVCVGGGPLVAVPAHNRIGNEVRALDRQSGRLEHEASLVFQEGPVLAGLDRPDGGQGVPVVGRGDRDDVDIFVFQELPQVLVLRRFFLRRSLDDGHPFGHPHLFIGIAHGNDVTILAGHESTQVRLTAAVQAQDRDAQTFVRARRLLFGARPGQQPGAGHRRGGRRQHRILEKFPTCLPNHQRVSC